MWGVFSRQGLLLCQFREFAEAALACRAWPQAVAVQWMGAVRIDR